MHCHKHDHCEHELKYCGHCDVVYCKKCGREWGVKTWYYPWTYTTPTITVPTWTTTSGSTVTDTEVYKCNHTG